MFFLPPPTTTITTTIFPIGSCHDTRHDGQILSHTHVHTHTHTHTAWGRMAELFGATAQGTREPAAAAAVRGHRSKNKKITPEWNPLRRVPSCCTSRPPHALGPPLPPSRGKNGKYVRRSCYYPGYFPHCLHCEWFGFGSGLSCSATMRVVGKSWALFSSAARLRLRIEAIFTLALVPAHWRNRARGAVLVPRAASKSVAGWVGCVGVGGG